ncbi:hypothetical protein [Vannielia litorea]|uniref:hypothetical protein n=1 Tax=Vannielia litorea TaxID=1217970 RepID=UPI001BD02159|nr:hypothetical protein [Vannielia litorea]MBS8228559.1 hypothetical protein [Vannielia litorea]
MIRAACLALVLASPLTAQPVLSIDITQSQGEDFGTAMAVALEAGAEATSLSLFWDDLEPNGPGYAPKNDWPTIANAVYPGQGLSLTLTFSVIDTLADRRRADLKGLAWDDPRVTSAFAAHLRDVLGRMPDADILAIAIGNEVDGHLQTPQEIAGFARFLAAARAELARLRPGVPVGTKLTHGAIAGNAGLWQPLLVRSSALMVTYYPLDAGFVARGPGVASADLSALAAVAPELPIYLLEAGYPSAGCSASEADQAAFVQNLMASAAATPRIALVSLTWLSDMAPHEAEALAAYYGLSNRCFIAYLGSIGLRRANGTAKPAFDVLSPP